MISLKYWREPPADLELHSNEVDVWSASLNVQSELFEFLQSVLSNDETSRAQRFVFDRGRNNYLVARGLLRIILSRYLEVKPNEFVFVYNKYGKPFLSEKFDKDRIYFNISHSKNMVVYGITRDREVGVDIEYVRSFERAEKVVERFFSEQEKEDFRTLPEDLKVKSFFTCWARKEAYIKACGKGLSLLKQFSVSLIPDEPARLKYTADASGKETHWTLKDILPIKGYVGAVAVKGDSLNFRYWKWV